MRNQDETPASSRAWPGFPLPALSSPLGSGSNPRPRLQLGETKSPLGLVGPGAARSRWPSEESPGGQERGCRGTKSCRAPHLGGGRPTRRSLLAPAAVRTCWEDEPVGEPWWPLSRASQHPWESDRSVASSRVAPSCPAVPSRRVSQLEKSHGRVVGHRDALRFVRTTSV